MYSKRIHIVFSIFLLILGGKSFAQDLSIISWNLKDFGQSRDDEEILLIAKEIKHADIVAIQEVVAKHPGGVQAVARLADQLNRMGSNWDYSYSDPTGDESPHKRERYAFLWKPSKVKLNRPIKLIDELDLSVCREPAIAHFLYKDDIISIMNYHACTHTKYYPERDEINSITDWIQIQKYSNLIWCGDMNLKIDDVAFNKAFNYGFTSVLSGEKTSLKKSCKNGNYLSRAEDNVLFKLRDASVKGFVLDIIADGDCNDVVWKRNSYSDHLAIEIRIR